MIRWFRTSSSAILGIALVVGTVVASTRIGEAADRMLDTARFDVATRRASGHVAIVEMDAASVAAIRRWPWSRSHYARVVDALRRAGAASIVFDVDFSTGSDAAGDAAFAASLRRADGIVTLPTFGQQAGTGSARTIDALPIPMLRETTSLASVSIAPDSDGVVRAMPLATMTAGVPRPTLSAYIAGRSGAADRTFPIDMAIDPATIPRLSFVAIERGGFDAAAVSGRNILIGATAIEMGDRYAVPVWGVLPGVVVQALAAETLLRGVPLAGDGAWPMLLAAMFVIALLTRRSLRAVLGTGFSGMVAIVVAVLIAQHRFGHLYPIAGSLALLGTAMAGAAARHVATRFQSQRTTDEATGLPNRHALPAATQGSLIVARLVNIDGLAAVLDRQSLTDAVVRTAERLRLMSADATVYRLDRHHLGFVMKDGSDPEAQLQGLRAILLQPVEVGGRRIDVAVAVGLAEEGDTERQVADAMLAADAAQRDGVFWRRAATDLDQLERQASLMGELDDALAAGQIDVFYQPKLSLAKGRPTSVEALVRWRHPARGFVGPDLFIPLAEQTDRIAPLTLYVVERVLADIATWRVLGHDLAAAINISAKLLSSAVFNAAIEHLLERSGIPTSLLIFEVTESAAMSNPDQAVAALRRYRELGIAVSMDDYGTGQSTLTYLRQLPLNELKIDRSFVQFAHRNRNDAVLVRSTIDLAHDLGLTVVAEGVEDAECLEFLRAAGCDLIQGYFISRPVSLDGLLTFMDARDAQAA